jgi:hypothetical protein
MVGTIKRYQSLIKKLEGILSETILKRKLAIKKAA